MIAQILSFARRFQNNENNHSSHQLDGPRFVFKAPAGISPAKIAVDEEADTIYVSNFESKDVSVLNGSTGELIRTLLLPENGADLTVSPISNLLYVSNPLQRTVTILDSLSGAIHSSVEVGYFPTQIVVHQRSKIAYVMNLIGKSVTAIDENHLVIFELNLDSTPTGIVIDEVNNLLLVGNRNKQTITVFSLLQSKQAPKRSGEIQFSSSPLHLSINPADGCLYVVLSGNGGVDIIDIMTRKRITQHLFESSVRDVVVLHSESLVFHTTEKSLEILVTNLSTGLLEHTISTENTPTSMASNQKTGMTFCVCATSNSITFIPLKTIRPLR